MKAWYLVAAVVIVVAWVAIRMLRRGRGGVTEIHLNREKPWNATANVLLALSAETATLESPASDALPSPKEIAARCAEEAQRVTRYNSRQVLRRVNVGGVEPGPGIQWDITFVKPDRYHTAQSQLPGGDYDEWIAIGEDRYTHMGFWFKSPEAREFRTDEFRRSLLADRFLRALGEVAPASAQAYGYRGQRYIRLEYSGATTAMFARLGDIAFGEGTDSVTGEATNVVLQSIDVWVDADSYLLANVAVASTATSVSDGIVDVAADQVFLDYDGSFEIEPPTDAPDNKLPSDFGAQFGR